MTNFVPRWATLIRKHALILLLCKLFYTPTPSNKASLTWALPFHKGLFTRFHLPGAGLISVAEPAIWGRELDLPVRRYCSSTPTLCRIRYAYPQNVARGVRVYCKLPCTQLYLRFCFSMVTDIEASISPRPQMGESPRSVHVG